MLRGLRLESAERRVILSALIVAAGFAAAKFTGVLDDFIVARVFARRELDAYYAAFGLPDLLFTLIAGGALAAAFIPVFTGYLAAGERAGAWKLASSVVNLAFLVTLAASILAALIAPWLVQSFVAPGFPPDQQLLTANLMRIILISTAIFSVSGIAMSALQANQHFLLPALASVMYNLGIIGGALFLTRPAVLEFPLDIRVQIWPVRALGVYGLAVGVVGGAAMHLLIQVPGLLRFGARWSPHITLSDPALRRVLSLLGPRLLGLGVVQLSMLITNNLASRLETGSVMGLALAWRLMQMPETIIATAVGTAVFPTLSELAAQGQLAGLRAMMRKTLGAIVLINAPAAVVLIVLGRELAGLAFGAESAGVVAWALQFYALGLVGHSALEVAARTFYAQQDTRTPLLVAAAAMVIAIAASLVLMRPLSYGGLALGNAIGFTVESGVLVWLMERRLRGK